MMFKQVLSVWLVAGVIITGFGGNVIPTSTTSGGVLGLGTEFKKESGDSDSDPGLDAYQLGYTVEGDE